MAEYRKIDGWPYSVSECGEVRNDRNGHILRQVVASGYNRVHLCDNGKSKCELVHRLVAKAFVPNPMLKPEVNHKDGDKLNNHFKNLEWVTGKENKKHCREVLGKINRNPDTTAAHEACKKSVRCVETGEEYESITFAARSIGVTQGSLSAQLLGIRRTCKGMRFEYV